MRRIAILALLVLLAPATAQAAEPGVVADLSWGITAAAQERETTILRDMGARWIRLHVQWKHVEPALPGLYDPWWLAHIDQAVAHAREADAKVLLMVYDAPVWASGSSRRSTPRNPDDYARFVGMLAERYRNTVAAYEIWNEQNTARFWTDPSPVGYARLLRAAHGAIKRVDRSATVVFGGLSTNDYRFVEAALDAGAGKSFDALAVHPYGYCGTEAPDAVRRGADGRLAHDSFLGYREVRASLLARGIDRPIWLTEFGWTTTSARCDPAAGAWQGGVDEATQASYVRRAFGAVERDPYVEVAITYSLRNNYWSHDADEPESRFGLLRSDFSPKPAFAAYVAYAKTVASVLSSIPQPIVRLAPPKPGSRTSGP